MTKPTKAQIKSIDLAKMDSGEFWSDLAGELLPGASEDKRSELASEIHKDESQKRQGKS